MFCKEDNSSVDATPPQRLPGPVPPRGAGTHVGECRSVQTTSPDNLRNQPTSKVCPESETKRNATSLNTYG